jgi:GntR family transcriptional regulator/MocR family aminotransferase
MRLLYGERRAVLVDALQKEIGAALRVIGDPAGLHLTALFPAGWDDRPISEQAARQGLWAMPLSACYLAACHLENMAVRPGLVLGYGGTSRTEILDGVRRLRGLLSAVL